MFLHTDSVNRYAASNRTFQDVMQVVIETHATEVTPPATLCLGVGCVTIYCLVAVRIRERNFTPLSFLLYDRLFSAGAAAVLRAHVQLGARTIDSPAA